MDFELHRFEESQGFVLEKRGLDRRTALSLQAQYSEKGVKTKIVYTGGLAWTAGRKLRGTV